MRSSIDIGRIGAPPGANFVDGVVVGWVAKRPSGGLKIVGWYKNARVFRALWRRAGCRAHANEFDQMRSVVNRASYRLCVVTNALKRTRRLCRFLYNPAAKKWCSEDDGSALEIKPVTGARVTIA